MEYCTGHWNGSEQRLAHTYSRLGICYAYLNEWDLAEMALSKAEKVLPWDIDMVYGRICILYGKKETHRILDYLDKNIEKYPKLYPLYFWKAEFIRHHLKNISKSLEYYEAALDRIGSRKFKRVYSRVYFTADTNAFPQYILFDYLDTLNDLGMVSEYFPVIRSYIRHCLLSKFESKDAIIYMHILAGNVQLAEKECRRLMNNIPDAATRSITLSLLALANMKQDMFEEALQRSMEAISTDASQIFTLRTIGTVLLHLEDWNRAKNLYERLMVIDSFNITWQEQLEIITRKLMEHERTISV